MALEPKRTSSPRTGNKKPLNVSTTSCEEKMQRLLKVGSKKNPKSRVLKKRKGSIRARGRVRLRNRIHDENIDELIEVSESGISFREFWQLNDGLYSVLEWAKLLRFHPRTIKEYSKIPHKRFRADKSEKIIKILTISKKGVEVFGNKENFLIWVHTEQPQFKGSSPFNYLQSNIGMDLVEAQIGRIEHGIFA